MKKIFLIGVVIYGWAVFLPASGFLGEVTKHLGGKGIFEPALEEKRKFLSELEKERNQLEASQPEFVQTIEREIASVENQIALVKPDLEKKPDDEFLLKKNAILNDRLLVLKEKIKVRKQLLDDKNELIKVTADFLSDPNLEDFKKEQKLFDTTAYTFEDIQTFKQKVLDAEKAIKFFDKQEQTITQELESRKQIIASMKESFKKKTDEFEAVMSSDSKTFDLDKRQMRELFALEEKTYKDKMELGTERLNEIETKKSLIKKKKIVDTAQLDLLKQALAVAKDRIRLNEADIAFAKDELTKKEREYFSRRETFSKEIERHKTKRQELDALSKRFNIPLGADLDDWSRVPKQTVEGYTGLFEVGALNDEVLLSISEKELLEARMDLEKEKFETEALLFIIKETYSKVTAKRFKTAEEIDSEIKKYEALKAGATANISLYEGRKNTASDRLDTEKKALENLKELRKEVEKQATVLFKNYDREYGRIISLLNSIEETIRKEIDVLGKLIDVYTQIINVNQNNIEQIQLVPDLRGAMQLLRRPETAISWKAIRSIIPDSRRFINDLYSYVTTLSFDAVIAKVKAIVSKPYDLLLFFIKLFLLMLGLLLLRIYVPKLSNHLSQLSIERWWLKLLILLFLFVSTFFVSYFFGIALWLVLYFIFYNLKVIDPYLTSLFYVASIPYFLYFANRFINSFIEFNEQHEYPFMKQPFQKRFSIVLSILLYSTVFLSFFRTAFQLLSYPKTELVRTLGALNFIILQIAVIFLFSKELILDLIPTTSDIGRSVLKFVDDYYYVLFPIVVVLIFMTNPYVGYGPLVLYILSRLLLTGLVVAILVWLHNRIKRISSSVFFIREDEGVKERFSYSKTWYGVFVIVIFLLMILVGIFIAAKIWNWPAALARITSWADIKSWLLTPIGLKESDYPISLASILQFLLIIVAGALASYAFNRFVLGRIFDVLLVEPGIQNAVSTLTRYLIIFGAIILGFQAIGLGEKVWIVFIALIFSIGWVIKDPVSDFFSYMLILVQRPLKIGDYVKLDPETLGVVRKITPRAVILRRKNSTTLIVPNSQLMKKVVTNWNYRPGFIAFDDIHVTTTYKTDPAVVRDVLLKVLDDSPYILKSPKPIVRLDSFGEIGYEFMLRGFVSSNYTLEIWNIASAIRIEVVHALYENDIELAIPIINIVKNSNNGWSHEPADEKVRE